MRCWKCQRIAIRRKIKRPEYYCVRCMREWDAIDGEDATVVASRNEYERYASEVEQIRRQQRAEREAAEIRRLEQLNRRKPVSGSAFESVFNIAIILVVGSMLALIGYMCATEGFPDMGGDDGYEEECAVEDRGGRIREICW